MVKGDGIYTTYEASTPKFHGIRPVVSLKAGITLKDRGETINNYTLWNIE